MIFEDLTLFDVCSFVSAQAVALMWACSGHQHVRMHHMGMHHQDIQAGILTTLAYKLQNNDKQMAFDVEIKRHLTMQPSYLQLHTTPHDKATVLS